MVKLRGTTQTRINKAKNDFNEVFQSRGLGGNTFEMDFIKETSKRPDGVNRLIEIYKKFVEDNKEVFGETENINEILNYGEKSRRAKFIKTLGDVSREPESNVKLNLFLREGLNYSDQQALKLLGVISSPTPSEIERVKEAVPRYTNQSLLYVYEKSLSLFIYLCT